MEMKRVSAAALKHQVIKNTKNKKLMALRVPVEICDRLDALAKRTGRTKSFYVRTALLEYIEDVEDAYDADEVMKRIRSGKEKVYTLAEVERHLGLDD
jgi:RHH-type transcriptional regulator, rel operon repressor / antitoxin RelB